jgi:hypothetical protein
MARRHHHAYRSIDVWHLPLLIPATMAKTVVLRVCSSCGWPDTVCIDGRWTIEQVRGQQISAVTMAATPAPGGGHIYATDQPLTRTAVANG